jgi:hypothetical protein
MTTIGIVVRNLIFISALLALVLEACLLWSCTRKPTTGLGIFGAHEFCAVCEEILSSKDGSC